MAHMVENITYVGETPWHGLGVQLATPPATVEEAIQKGNLGRERQLHQLYLQDGTPVDQWAVVRSDDKQVHGYVGKNFRLLQDREVFTPILTPFVEAGLASIETCGSLKQGAQTWMLVKLNRPDSVIVPRADDRVAKYLLVSNGFDGWLSVFTGYTPVRVVCKNTLFAAIQEGLKQLVKIKHTAGAKMQIKAVAEVIQRVDGDFEKSAEIYRALAQVPVRSAKELREYVDAVFPARPRKKDRHEARGAAEAAAAAGPGAEEESRKVFEAVEHLFHEGQGNAEPGVKNTAWAAYNAVTEYLTWQRGSSPDARATTVWFRQNTLPAAALNKARERFLVAA